MVAHSKPTLARRLPAPCRRPAVFGCIFLALTGAAPAADATSVVSNCNDAGIGSLRNAIAAAPEGDVIDLSGLTASDPGCSASAISLMTGEIVVAQNDLTILGSGRNALAVTIAPPIRSRILNHIGDGTTTTGTLRIQDLSITSGYNGVATTASVRGGCIYSRENVQLVSAAITNCTAAAYAHGAVGGGIYARGALTLEHSIVSGNVVRSNAVANGGLALAGGAYVHGGFVASYSTISNNAAAAEFGDAGGLSINAHSLPGNSTVLIKIDNSTISGNTAYHSVGGIQFGAVHALITNSTISGNTAILGSKGGLFVVEPIAVGIYNSTIAFNSAGVTDSGGRHYSAGATFMGRPYERPSLAGQFDSSSVILRNTLISNNVNSSYGSADDFSVVSALFVLPVDISGANNLIFSEFGTADPPDTLRGICPLLAPLRDNGGATQTHALFSGSPAMDAGAGSGFSFDQRGQGYPRAVGPVDIGSYEMQGDVIFAAGMDGCP